MIIPLALRGIQILFAAVVLALSVVLAKGQVYGSPPAVTSFNAFNGAWGLLVALIGIAAAFLSDTIPSIVPAALDGLATLFYFAGGVAYAVKLGVHSCSPSKPDGAGSGWPSSANINTILNSVINGGISSDGDLGPNVNYQSRCEEAQADTAFLFFGFAVFAASLVYTFFSGGFSRKGGRSSYV